jgi:hypothetical protein
VPPIVPDPFRILYVREQLSGLVDKGRGTLRLLYVYIYLFDDPICQVGETGLVGLRMWIYFFLSTSNYPSGTK